jgi:DNA replication ATP-dependent helicase Dna2
MLLNTTAVISPGKTSAIVALVRVLVTLGQSVLLTSYTHSAVDNILLKLNKHNVPFIRIGRTERIHPDVRHRSTDSLTKEMSTVQEIADLYASVVCVFLPSLYLLAFCN